MAEIIRAAIGVSIDPRQAQAGARAAVAAAESMRAGMNNAATGAERAFSSMRASTARAAESMGRLKEAARAGGQSVETAGGKASRAKQQLEQLRNSASKAGTAFHALGDAVGIFSPRLGNLMTTAGRLRASMGAVQSSLGAVGSAASGAGGGVGSMAMKIGMIAGVAGVAIGALGALAAAFVAIKVGAWAASKATDLLVNSIQLAADEANTRISFEVILQDKGSAKKLIGELKQLANTTPLTTDEVVKAGLALTAFGESAETAADTVRRLGDVSSAFKDLSLNELAQIYGKIQTSGRIEGEDINQLGGRGIPILEELAKVTGRAKEEIRGLVTEGRIGAEHVTAAFENMTNAGGKFFGLMAAQSQEFNGLKSTLLSGWEEVQRAFGEPIAAALTPMLQDAITGMGDLQDLVESWKPAISAIAETLAGTVQLALSGGEGFDIAWDATVATLKQLVIAAFDVAVDSLRVGMESAAQAFGGMLKNSVSEGGFWSNLAEGLGITIQEGAAKAKAEMEQKGILGYVQTLPKKGLEAGVGMAADSYVIGDVLRGMTGTEGKASSVDLAGASAALQANVKGTAAAQRLTTALEKQTAAANYGKPVLDPKKPFSPALDMENWFTAKMREEFVQIPLNEARGGEGAARTSADAMLRRDPNERLRMDNAKAQDLFAKGALDQGQLSSMLAINAATAAKALKAAEPKMEVRKALAADGTGTAIESQRAMESQAAAVKASVMTPVEEYQKQVDALGKLQAAGLITSDEFSKAKDKASADYIGALERISEAQTRMAEQNMSQLEKLMRTWADLTTQVDTAAVASANVIANNMTSAIMELVNGTKTAGEAFEAMASQIINQITQIVVQLMVQYAISQALGYAMPGFGGGKSVSVRHDGSGDGDARKRSVSPGLFASAQRFHSGGKVPGLAADEIPAILQKDEEVLTREDASALRTKVTGVESGGGQKQGGTSLTVLNVDDPERIKEILANNPDVVLNIINRNAPIIKRMLT